MRHQCCFCLGFQIYWEPLRKAGVLGPLLDAIFTENEPLQKNAVKCISVLAQDSASAEEIHRTGGLLALVNLLGHTRTRPQSQLSAH